MAEFQKIETEEQLAAWLKMQDLRMIRMIAARAGLRSLPAAMAMVDQKVGSLDGKDLLLACLRATLLTGAASSCPILDMSWVGRAALTAAFAARAAGVARLTDDSASKAADSAAESAAFAAHSVLESKSAADSAARSAADSAASAARYGGSAVGHSVFAEALQDIQSSEEQVLSTRLWSEGNEIAELQTLWQAFEARADPEGHWDFWKRWYRGMLNGTPLDWDLQLQVARIEPEVWDAGPKAVAQEIAKIENLFELVQEIVRLKEQLSAANSVEAAPNRLHNHPPEAVEEEVQVIRQEITLVWEEIEALEVELEKPEPSPEVLEKIAKALWVASLKITAYCAELSDIALKSTAKWSGPVGAAYLVTPDGLQRVSKLTSELTKLLVGG